MDGKYLGKIEFADYGIDADGKQDIGLRLGFTFGGNGVGSGDRYVTNLAARDTTEGEIQAELTETTRAIRDILLAAKCYSVSELKGKPVEVTIEKNTFKSFRILTEVL